jgi:hypothetical protein
MAEPGCVKRWGVDEEADFSGRVRSVGGVVGEGVCSGMVVVSGSGCDVQPDDFESSTKEQHTTRPIKLVAEKMCNALQLLCH